MNMLLASLAMLNDTFLVIFKHCATYGEKSRAGFMAQPALKAKLK